MGLSQALGGIYVIDAIPESASRAVTVVVVAYGRDVVTAQTLLIRVPTAFC